MDNPPRRRILQSIVPLSALLCGCSSIGTGSQEPPETDTATPEPTEPPPENTTTTAGLTPSSFRFESSVIAQSTVNEPLMIESAIVNEGEEAVLILPGGAGRALDYIPPLVGHDVQLVLFPDSSAVSTFGITDEQVEGCWRFVTDSGERAVRKVLATSFPVSLEAKSRYAVRYEVYQDGSAGVCFPEGSYQADVAVDFSEPDGDVLFTKDLKYDLEISEDGQAVFNLRV